MSVYARSDVGYVAVPATSGGCGESHRRPTDAEGALVKVWQLDCPQCGNYLRHDPHWGGMISEIPETPDEVRVREDEEKRGQRETAAATSHALTQIADLPNGMATAFAQAFAVALKGMNGTPELVEADKRCPNDHPVPRNAKFCPECGARSWKAPAKVVESQVVKPMEPMDLKADVPSFAAAPENKLVRSETHAMLDELEGKSMPQLREVAHQVGAKIRRSRDEQVAEIRAAVLVGKQG